jgi:hypothetical protein
MVKTNTVDVPDAQARASWPPKDCIRWIEWRVRELTIENSEYVDARGRWLLEEKAAGGRKLTLSDKVADYAVWLFKVRDNLSWHQIAYRFFPNATEVNIEKYESKVRRSYSRVEKNHPGSVNFKQPRLSRYDAIALNAVLTGVIPIYVSAATDSNQE